MAFSTVKAFIVVYPKLGSFAETKNRAVFFENLNLTNLYKLSSKSAGNYPKPKYILGLTEPVAFQVTAQCRDSLLSSLQSHVRPMYDMIQYESETSRIYFNVDSHFSNTLFERALDLSGYPKDCCYQSKTDKSVFSIPINYFDWCRLSVLIFLLRSTDFIDESAYMEDKTLIEAMFKHPLKCFPNNDEQTWRTIILAYAIYNRNRGHCSNMNVLGYSGFESRGGGINNVTEAAIYKDLWRFFNFCDEFNVSDNMVCRLSSPLKGISMVDLRRINRKEFTLHPEKKSTEPRPELIEENNDEEDEYDWDDDDEDDDEN